MIWVHGVTIANCLMIAFCVVGMSAGWHAPPTSSFITMWVAVVIGIETVVAITR